MTPEQYEHLRRDMLQEEVSGYADLTEDEEDEADAGLAVKDKAEVLVEKSEGYDDESF